MQLESMLNGFDSVLILSVVGTCHCNEGFVTDDCSINIHKPPLMNGIPEVGLCDLTRRQCSRTSVLGEDFYSSENLICKLIPFLVSTNALKCQYV